MPPEVKFDSLFESGNLDAVFQVKGFIFRLISMSMIVLCELTRILKVIFNGFISKCRILEQK